MGIAVATWQRNKAADKVRQLEDEVAAASPPSPQLMQDLAVARTMLAGAEEALRAEEGVAASRVPGQA